MSVVADILPVRFTRRRVAARPFDFDLKQSASFAAKVAILATLFVATGLIVLQPFVMPTPKEIAELFARMNLADATGAGAQQGPRENPRPVHSGQPFDFPQAIFQARLLIPPDQIRNLTGLVVRRRKIQLDAARGPLNETEKVERTRIVKAGLKDLNLWSDPAVERIETILRPAMAGKFPFAPDAGFAAPQSLLMTIVVWILGLFSIWKSYRKSRAARSADLI